MGFSHFYIWEILFPFVNVAVTSYCLILFGFLCARAVGI